MQKFHLEIYLWLPTIQIFCDPPLEPEGSEDFSMSSSSVVCYNVLYVRFSMQMVRGLLIDIIMGRFDDVTT